MTRDLAEMQSEIDGLRIIARVALEHAGMPEMTIRLVLAAAAVAPTLEAAKPWTAEDYEDFYEQERGGGAGTADVAQYKAWTERAELPANTWQGTDADLMAEIKRRRDDPEYMARLRDLIDDNKDILDRLALNDTEDYRS